MPEVSSTFVSRDPTTGAVTFNFTGHVHAQGLDLDAAPLATPPTQDRIRWIRQSDGAVIADLISTSIPNKDLGALETHIPTADAAGTDGFAIMQVTDDAGAGNSNLTIQQRKGSIATANTRITAATAGNLGFTIIDGLGQSSFLTANAALGQWTVGWGTAVAVFAGVNNVNVTITHNIGRVPAFPDAICINGGVFGPFASVISTSTTQATFNILVSNFGVITANVTFFWVVIA